MQNVAAPLRTIIRRLSPPSGWSRVRGFAVMLMLAAQIALGLHQFQHYVSLDVDSENHCVLCHVASGQDTGGSPPAVVLPAQTVLYAQSYVPSERALLRLQITADYQSRAPPIPVSI